MYESSNHSYISIKYGPLMIGILFLIFAFWIMLDPSFEFTINGVKRNAIFSDSLIPLFFGLANIIFYLSFGQKIVKMRINRNEFEFITKEGKSIKNWSEIKNLKKYWFVAPPLYSVKFKNEKKTYYFTTSYFFIVTPFYVFDLSDMGSFIKKRKRDIPLLKDLREENNYTT